MEQEKRHIVDIEQNENVSNVLTNPENIELIDTACTQSNSLNECEIIVENKKVECENLMEVESKPTESYEIQANVFANPCIATGLSIPSGDNNQSLNMLAMYGSESESELEIDKNLYRTDTRGDRQSSNIEDSSSSSSESSSSSSSSESDSDSSSSDVDCLEAIEMEIDEKAKSKFSGPVKVKGEFLITDLPPIEDLKITVPENECIEVGKITSVVDQLVIVESIPGAIPLDLDTLLFLDKGQKTLGKIFDVLGQVMSPLYCIRFNSAQQIEENGIKIGLSVYCAPRTEHTSFVILSNLMTFKGSDASWENDVEPTPGHIEYSDDEQERSARRALKAVRVQEDDPNKKQKTMENKPNYRPRNQRGNHNYRGHRSQAPGRFQRPQYPPAHDFNSWHHNFNNNMPGPSFVNPYTMPASHPGFYQVQFPPPPPPPPST